MTTEQYTDLEQKVRLYVTSEIHSVDAQGLVNKIQGLEGQPVSFEYDPELICKREGWFRYEHPNNGFVLCHTDKPRAIYQPRNRFSGGIIEIIFNQDLDFLDENYYFEKDEDVEKEVWDELYEVLCKKNYFYKEHWLVSNILFENLEKRGQPLAQWGGQNIWQRLNYGDNKLRLYEDPVIIEIVKKIYNL